MPHLNRVMLIGTAVKRSPLRWVKESLPVVDLSIRVTERFRDRAGEAASRETVFPVVAFGPVAEALAATVNEGDELLVQGRLKMESRMEEGAKITSYRVIADRFERAAGMESPPKGAAAEPPAPPEASEAGEGGPPGAEESAGESPRRRKRRSGMIAAAGAA